MPSGVPPTQFYLTNVIRQRIPECLNIRIPEYLTTWRIFLLIILCAVALCTAVSGAQTNPLGQVVELLNECSATLDAILDLQNQKISFYMLHAIFDVHNHKMSPNNLDGILEYQKH